MTNPPTESEFEAKRPRWSRAWSVFAVVLAALTLNFALGFYNLWPTPWVTLEPKVSVEAALLILLLAGLAIWRKPLSARSSIWLALVLLVMVLGRYLDVTAPSLYGRPINLYWDAQHLPAVAAMLASVASWPQLLMASCVALAAFAALFWLLRVVVQSVSRATGDAQLRRWLAGCSFAVLGLWVVGSWLQPAWVDRWFTRPVSLSWGQQFNQLRLTLGDRVAQDFAQSPLPTSDLSAISGADVLVMFIESYGITTVNKTAHANALAPALARLQSAVTDTNRYVASGRVTSPTFGGGSWLAHASFLTGYEVRDGDTYKHLLASERQSWTQAFAAAGYRTLGLMPGIRMPWPEGQYYEFDKLYNAAVLDYQGIEFGWWRIPDQFALARLDAQERLTESPELTHNARQPAFVFFTTITSHAPFRPVAPYQADWQSLLDAQPYDPAEAAQAINQKPDWLNLSPAYVESIDYAITTAAGYLRHRRDSDLVLVLIGDHQPTATVTGPDASWQVPVHVISNRKPVIDALVEQGLKMGAVPPTTGQGPMHEFSAALLRVFGAAGVHEASVNISGAIPGPKRR